MDENQVTGTQNQGQDAISNPIIPQEGVIIERDPLLVNLNTVEFIKRSNALTTQTKNFYTQNYDLYERRKKNETYYFGRQLNKANLKSYSTKFIDNVIYEGMSYLKPMALSRMPDIVVKPGSNTEESEHTAELISKAVTGDVQSREWKRVLGLVFKQLPIGFIGCIKAIWNPQRGKYGDYEFKVVHYDNVIFDHTAQTNDPADMEYINEYVEWSVKEWIMRFPDKKKEFIDELTLKGVFTADATADNEAGLSTKVKGNEIHFTHYDKHQDDTYEKIECIGWYYENCVLKLMKTPNWDWEGVPQTFKYNDPVTADDLKDALINQNFADFQTKTVFHNHFDTPQKPYIFIGYDQFGKTPMDETSMVEQVRLLQENYDKRGKQLTEILDRSRGKHIFSSEEGLKAEDLEEMDMNNPDQDVLVKGDVRKVHDFIPGEQPTPALIEHIDMLHERILDKMGVHGPARGEVNQSAPATNNQLSREGDFSRSDDYTDDTINYAAERMANWILQFIKLRYTEDHMKRILGVDGKVVFTKINRDMIEDGMEVNISASGTDKLKREQRAMDMAKLGLTDPFSFFKDLSMDDPVGRTEKLMLFKTNPPEYINQIKGAGSSYAPTNQQGQDQGTQQAMMDIAQIQQGIIPPLPQPVTPGYIQTFSNFMNDPNGAEYTLSAFPELRDQLLQFAQAISQQAKMMPPQALAQPQQDQPPQPGAPQGQQPPIGGGASVGPMSGTPNPASPGKVAALPGSVSQV